VLTLDNYDDGEQWNMAQAYLKRIDFILTLCDQCHYKDDPRGWFKALYQLYKEIYPKMKDKEKEESKKFLDILIKYKNNNFKTNGKKMRKNEVVLVNYDVFIDLELYLRQLLENKKMLTPKADDPSRSYRS